MPAQAPPFPINAGGPCAAPARPLLALRHTETGASGCERSRRRHCGPRVLSGSGGRLFVGVGAPRPPRAGGRGTVSYVVYTVHSEDGVSPRVGGGGTCRGAGWRTDCGGGQVPRVPLVAPLFPSTPPGSRAAGHNRRASCPALPPLALASLVCRCAGTTTLPEPFACLRVSPPLLHVTPRVPLGSSAPDTQRTRPASCRYLPVCWPPPLRGNLAAALNPLPCYS